MKKSGEHEASLLNGKDAESVPKAIPDEMAMKRILWTATLACALVAAAPAKAADFTLSESAILSLDDNMSNVVAESSSDIYTATILSSQDIPGTGVVFTIHFPGTNYTDSSLFWTSNFAHGNGTLAGLDVSAYTNFVLKFTFLSIDGSSNAPGFLEVGALTGPYFSFHFGYHPDVVSLTGEFPPSVISTMVIATATINDLGFVVNEWPFGS